MVLAVKVGKARSFGAGFWLSIATVGLYGWWWNYRAHAELYRQFELAREGRKEGAEWYVLGLSLPLAGGIASFVYFHTFAANLLALRQRMGRVGGVTPGNLLALIIPAWSILLLFVVGAVVRAESALAWTDCATAGCLPGLVVVDARELVGAIGVFIVGLIPWGVLRTIAFYRLQRDVNEVWTLYDYRAAQLAQASVTAPSQSPAPRLPGGPAPPPSTPTAPRSTPIARPATRPPNLR